MNRNFTHRKLKNFELRFLNFYTIQTSLPASPWFAVNFLLMQFNNLLMLPAVSIFFIGIKPELKPAPVIIGNTCNYKK